MREDVEMPRWKLATYFGCVFACGALVAAWQLLEAPERRRPGAVAREGAIEGRSVAALGERLEGEGLSRRQAATRSVVLRVEDASSETAEALNGTLVAEVVGAGAQASIEVPIREGGARIDLPSSSQSSPATCFIRSVVDVDKGLATEVSPRIVAVDGGTQRIRVDFVAPWRPVVELRPCSRAARSAVAVVMSEVGAEGGSSPPVGATHLASVAAGSAVDLPAPRGDGDVDFWFGAEGYCWTRIAWRERGLWAERIELEPVARLVLSSPEGAAGHRVELFRLSADRAPAEVGEWILEAAGQAQVSVAGGEYALRMRSLDSDDAEAQVRRMTLSPCEDVKVVVLTEGSRGALTVHGAGSATGSLHRVDRTGLAVEARPLEAELVSAASGRTALRWEGVPAGEYFIQIENGDLFSVELDGRARELVWPDRPRAPRGISFVDAATGRPLRAAWIRWAALANPDPLSLGVLPPQSGSVEPRSTEVVLDLPDGAWHYTCLVDGLPYVGTEWVDGRSTMAVEIARAATLVLDGVGLLESPRWLERIEFERQLERVAASEVTIGRGPSGPELTVYGGVPDRVLLPPSGRRRFPSAVLDWPSGASAVRVDELDGALTLRALSR